MRQVFRFAVALWAHMSRKRRIQIPLLIGLMTLGALMEVIGLGAIIPFLGALASPESILEHPLGAVAAKLVGASTGQELVFPLAVFFAGTAIASAAVRLIILYANNRLALAIGGDLGITAYRRTLYQPYPVHISRNSSTVISTIYLKTKHLVSIIFQSFNMISQFVLAVGISAAILLIEPKIAVPTAAVFGASYLLITLFFRKTLYANSVIQARLEESGLQILQEGLGGVRDVLLGAAQDIYTEKYKRVDFPMRHARAMNIFLSACPRYILEAAGMTMVAALAYFLAAKGEPGAFIKTIPILGAFALGAQKILPAFQQMFAAWASVVGNQKAIGEVLAMVDQPIDPLWNGAHPKALHFSDGITVENLRFRYGGDKPWVLDGLNLSIKKGERIGIVGDTGSGKSTFVDILLGLLQPTEGKVLIDGAALSSANIRAWQRTIANVPQTIFLADATISENIAFGLMKNKIDSERVRRAAEQAAISEFVENNPKAYDAGVGERGVQISGGQRQRLGIARALYHQASVLVLDEATSALDDETERQVMQTIDGLDKNLTILMVAHRVSTLANCDRIIEISHGAAVIHPSHGAFVASRKES